MYRDSKWWYDVSKNVVLMYESEDDVTMIMIMTN